MEQDKGFRGRMLDAVSSIHLTHAVLTPQESKLLTRDMSIVKGSEENTTSEDPEIPHANHSK